MIIIEMLYLITLLQVINGMSVATINGAFYRNVRQGQYFVGFYLKILDNIPDLQTCTVK